MPKPLRVLLIEDSESDAQLILRLLRRGGFEPDFRRVDEAPDLAAALREGPWDIILSDHSMPRFSSTAALEMVKANQADIPFIIVSNSIGEDVAVKAMRAGAQDYLMKDNLTRLVAAVERELKDAADRRARRAAEHELLAQQEAMRIARDVQRRLLPAEPPRLPGFDIAGASHPADATGGDYYDFLPGPGNELLIAIGDVTGHGVGPALLMADVHAYLHSLALAQTGFRALLENANGLLCHDTGKERFVTFFLASLDPASRRFRWLNAGHPAGFVLDAAGKAKAELGPIAPALGLFPEAAFPEASELTLAPGDTVLLLTDGLLEAAGPEGDAFGVERTLDLVRRERGRGAAAVIESLFAAVQAFTGTEGIQDDLTAIVVTVAGG
ncbi:MAG: SpoIIE family protein phosphatase [Lentisphaeria bacterium]|jgi:serine phosphatase RsbU (regulator of sigma subunit)